MKSEWPIVPFGEILTPNRRPYTLGPSEDADLVGMRLYGEGPFHRELKPAAKIQKKSHFVIRSGDVIYNKLFAWKGTFGIVPEELDGMYVSDKFPTYAVDSKKVYPEFLRLYFCYPALWDEAKKLSIGSAALSKLTLNPSSFLELEIPLPNLDQQIHVASQLKELLARVSELKELREHANRQATCYLFSVCDEYLRKFEERYKAKSLIKLTQSDRQISYGIVQTGKETEGGVPTLRAGDLKWFKVRTSEVKRVDPEIERNFTRTKLNGGEILLRIRGGVGEVAICPNEMIGGNISREIAIIPLEDSINSEYAMYLLASPTIQRRMMGNVRGTSYVGLNLQDVRSIELPIPPMREQLNMVKHINQIRSQVDTLQTTQVTCGRDVDSLRLVILRYGFDGSL